MDTQPDQDLPELPQPGNGSVQVGRESVCLGYDADQMRAYARQALAAQASQKGRGEAVLVDWRIETEDPIAEIDVIYAEYSKTFGKPAPDAEMARIVGKVHHMLFHWWAWHRDVIRSSLVAYLEPHPPSAAPLVGRMDEAEMQSVILESSAKNHIRFVSRSYGQCSTDTVSLESLHSIARAIESAVLAKLAPPASQRTEVVG